ncbi:MAG TPA: hypothetical protein VJ576_00315, partial [Rhodocyclaceae bacterium]|nr:hypothetical protein [Rhodocyclaceae bacterium]
DRGSIIPGPSPDSVIPGPRQESIIPGPDRGSIIPGTSSNSSGDTGRRKSPVWTPDRIDGSQ